MDYYIISEDSRVSKPLSFENYKLEQAKNTDDFVILTKVDRDTKIIDYISKRFLFYTSHVFSNKVKEVLEIYSYLEANRIICLTDFENSKQFIYWELKFQNIDCVIPKPNMNYHNLDLTENKIKNYKIFNIAFEKQSYIVLRFDVVESILRRYPIGIKFIKVNLK